MRAHTLFWHARGAAIGALLAWGAFRIVSLSLLKPWLLRGGLRVQVDERSRRRTIRLGQALWVSTHPDSQRTDAPRICTGAEWTDGPVFKLDRRIVTAAAAQAAVRAAAMSEGALAFATERVRGSALLRGGGGGGGGNEQQAESSQEPSQPPSPYEIACLLGEVNALRVYLIYDVLSKALPAAVAGAAAAVAGPAPAADGDDDEPPRPLTASLLVARVAVARVRCAAAAAAATDVAPRGIAALTHALSGFNRGGSGRGAVGNGTAGRNRRRRLCTASAADSRAVYAAVRCVGRWGEIVRERAAADAELAEAERRLADAREDAERARESIEGLLQRVIQQEQEQEQGEQGGG